VEFEGRLAIAEGLRDGSPALANRARAVKVRPGEQHANLQRWRAAMASRPSMAL